MPRIAVVENEKCHPYKCGGYYCAKVCPVNKKGDECIFHAEDGKAGIDENLCIGCHICVKRCPFDALNIINLPNELTKTPVHRYGRNGFHLYNLPIPIFGKVVGLVGRNGIGKTTAIKILSGILKPNLGTDKEANWEDLVEYYKGSEAQQYFERVKNKEITVSYKPQQVDLIPLTAKGTVRDLLAKVDEKGQMDEIAEILSLTKILDRDIAKLSGGELQRTAIAATVLKKANVYVFDEPTSFLDLKQRIRVSKFVKSLADEKTAVLVVEHDLIMLDFMTDLIHIVYGKESVYGIISQPKSSRTGINTYLEGFIREENMRFRDHQIRFDPAPPLKKENNPAIVNWSNVLLSLDGFSILAKEGQIQKKEVLGVLGENGIGKTTFVKILAGVQKQSQGTIDAEVKVAYKRQYLESSSEKTVSELLMTALQKYEIELIRPLNIKPLLEKRLCDLSGGELQRVSIAFCLSQDAKLYLLDEPSAYLDVEQRLIVSRILRDLMDHRGTACLVVDHDLCFIDYLAQALLLFNGEPSVKGEVNGPFEMHEGMNRFLTEIEMTFRRDPESGRPRANKLGSVLDRQQIEEGKRYYS